MHSSSTSSGKISNIIAFTEEGSDDCDECHIPMFGNDIHYELPEYPEKLKDLILEFKDRFSSTPGLTDITCHRICTEESKPIRVPPEGFQNMLNQGIIRKSHSPWIAPAVYVAKKDGGIRICVDYRELNKRTVKNAYPLPLTDDIQSYLTGAQVFSTLDLHSGYWQLPVHKDDFEKTAFSPGPGMGLYEFVRMPFGVCNGPSSFQRMMESVLHGSKNSKVFIDDILVFQVCMQEHVKSKCVVQKYGCPYFV